MKRVIFATPALAGLAILPMLAACSSGPATSSTSASSTIATSTTTTTTTAAPSSSSPGSSSPGSSTSSSPGSSSPGSSSPGSSSTASSPAAGARCAAGALAASTAKVGAAAGSAYYTIELRNTGSNACTLSGYPGVSLVAGSNGAQIGAAAKRSPTGSARDVRLSPRGGTTFQVQVAQAGNFPKDACRPTATRGFRIYPPGSRQALFVAGSGITGCSAKGINVLTVGPVGAAR